MKRKETAKRNAYVKRHVKIGMKDKLIKDWFYTRKILEEVSTFYGLTDKGARSVLEANLAGLTYKQLKEFLNSKTSIKVQTAGMYGEIKTLGKPCETLQYITHVQSR